MIASQESEMIVALLFASLRLIDFISNLELSRVERIELKSSCYQVMLYCLLRWSMLESSTMSSSLLEGCLEMLPLAKLDCQSSLALGPISIA